MTGYIGIGGTAKKVKNIYVGVGGVAKKVKKGYIGVGGVAKLWYSSQREWVWDKYTVNTGYNEVQGTSIAVNRNSAFYAGTSYTLSQSTGEFTVAQTTQIARSRTGATNAVGKYYISLSSSSGTQTGSTVYRITAASYSFYTLNLTVTPITSQYYEAKGSLIGSVTDLDVTAYPINGIQNGYWYALQYDYTLSYSGNYIETRVTVGSKHYRQLELQSSGTLALSKTVHADVWICGGGGCGAEGDHVEGSFNTPSNYGGAGAYAAASNNVSVQNLVVTIGSGSTSGTSAGGATSLAGDLSLVANGGNDGGKSGVNGCGGTGAGRGYLGAVGTGDGLDKTPFNDDSLLPLCDGAGGGGYDDTEDYHSTGGDGGTNGGNGKTTNSNPSGINNRGGLGGGLYGGRGGDGYYLASAGDIYTDGHNATGYGSGGGGGGLYGSYIGSGGYGYQGVCFIRVPLE